MRKALKAYGPPGLNAEGVFVLIDNTLLRSAKDGLMITRDSLLARSGIGGELNLRFDAIESVTVCKKSHMGVPIFGLEINEEHFAALPGLALPADGYDDVLLAPLAAMLLELVKKAKD